MVLRKVEFYQQNHLTFKKNIYILVSKQEYINLLK